VHARSVIKAQNENLMLVCSTIFSFSVYGSLSEVEAGAKRLAQIVLGASHLVQTAVPALLDSENTVIQEWKAQLRWTLEDQAKFLCSQLAQCRGLEVAKPSGAMYCLVGISARNSQIPSDVEFAALLLQEENVFVLPGTAFGVPGFFRVVFCSPKEILADAAKRIKSFCERHFLE
jgi:aspartate/methionine/tyrosine aminotransferase